MSTETRAPMPSAAASRAEEEREQYFVASHWVLMRRKFTRHKLAVVSAVILGVLYFTALFAGFFSPYDKIKSRTELAFLPPTRVHVFHDGQLQRPFVYGLAQERDPATFLLVFSEDRETRYPIRLFVTGEPYKLWGLFDARLRLFGVDDPAVVYLFGADDLGRDVLTRVIHGAQISLSIGLVGIALSFVLGALLGGASGLLGGGVDMIIQRIVEFIEAMPGMIIGETGLSFLGLGLTSPTVSWGVQLQQASNVSVIALNPWLLIPGIFVFVTVLCYNAVGDGLRDAADPYK